MDITKYLQDPTLIQGLDSETKIQVYQTLQDLCNQSQAEQSKIQGQIEQVQSQITELQSQIQQFTTQDPQEFLNSLEANLTTELQSTLQQYQEYQTQLQGVSCN